MRHTTGSGAKSGLNLGSPGTKLSRFDSFRHTSTTSRTLWDQVVVFCLVHPQHNDFVEPGKDCGVNGPRPSITPNDLRPTR